MSTSYVSFEGSPERESMDVDEDAYQERAQPWAGCSDDTSSTSATGILDDGDAAAREDATDAKLENTPCWGEPAAAADSPVEDPSLRPSRWLRMLWKLFDWRA